MKKEIICFPILLGLMPKGAYLSYKPIIGAFAGVLTIAVLQNEPAQIGVSEPTKRLITRAVILIAVLIDRWRAKHASAS